MSFAKDFRDLKVYEKSKIAAKEIFEISKSFPKAETYSLTDQIRRSSRSIGAQIAEAWGKRRYERHFISKLTDADGENFETQHWIEIAADCEYITQETAMALIRQYEEINRMLNSMIQKAHLFCQPSDHNVREFPAEYLVESEK